MLQINIVDHPFSFSNADKYYRRDVGEVLESCSRSAGEILERCCRDIREELERCRSD